MKKGIKPKGGEDKKTEGEGGEGGKGGKGGKGGGGDGHEGHGHGAAENHKESPEEFIPPELKPPTVKDGHEGHGHGGAENHGGGLMQRDQYDFDFSSLE
jgi:hypothetical protein